MGMALNGLGGLNKSENGVYDTPVRRDGEAFKLVGE